MTAAASTTASSTGSQPPVCRECARISALVAPDAVQRLAAAVRGMLHSIPPTQAQRLEGFPALFQAALRQVGGVSVSLQGLSPATQALVSWVVVITAAVMMLDFPSDDDRADDRAGYL